MLDNYEKLPNGVIKQIDRKPFQYDVEYSNYYNKLGEIGVRMAYLRLGHLIGSLGFIPDSILDVGYGNGDFISSATNIVPNCYAHDVSNYPVPDGVEFIEDITDFKVDVITFYDVLEHYEDIYDITKLNAEYIVVSLPNCHYFNDEWFENWKHRKPDEHLWHFDKDALVTFMDEVGYDVINLSNFEDTIRKPIDDKSNILTGIFKKR